MPSPSRALALAVALALAPHAARAASEPGDETERWVPAFSVFFDVLGQKTRSSATSGNVLGPPLTEGGCQLTAGGRNGDLCPIAPGDNVNSERKIQPDDRGSDTNVVPGVGASLELMTPRLMDRLLRPRLFVRGEATATFGFERNIAGVGAPGPLAPPEALPGSVANDIQERTVAGQGTRAKLQTRTWTFGGGGGVAFTIDAFQRRLRIKPSFEYMRQELDLITTVRRAVKLVEDSEPPSAGLRPNEFRTIVLESERRVTLDGFGPGLELEADTMHVGPFLMSVYAMGRGYYFSDDLDHTLTVTNQFGETATWTYEIEPWLWRSGVGVRFRWVPE